MRLPRARREFELLLHMAAGALRPGGRLLVYGANDEGVKSVSRRLDPLFERPVTLATGGHARVIAAWRVSEGPHAKCALSDWVSRIEVDIVGRVRPWVSYPGVFAHGRVDEGTALLLEHLPAIAPEARVLDYGAGTGVLAAGALERCPTARVTALEPDGLAAAAAAENVPEARIRIGRGWDALAEAGEWDLIVANPPYHRGKAETLAEIEAFLSGVPTHLSRTGTMRCVVQRRLPFEERAQAAGLKKIRVVADRGPYRVWEASR
jgi:16S rRNA (guanine1207-N2)-methyltransferase